MKKMRKFGFNFKETEVLLTVHKLLELLFLAEIIKVLR